MTIITLKYSRTAINTPILKIYTVSQTWHFYKITRWLVSWLVDWFVSIRMIRYGSRGWNKNPLLRSLVLRKVWKFCVIVVCICILCIIVCNCLTVWLSCSSKWCINSDMLAFFGYFKHIGRSEKNTFHLNRGKLLCFCLLLLSIAVRSWIFTWKDDQKEHHDFVCTLLL